MAVNDCCGDALDAEALCAAIIGLPIQPLSTTPPLLLIRPIYDLSLAQCFGQLVQHGVFTYTLKQNNAVVNATFNAASMRISDGWVDAQLKMTATGAGATPNTEIKVTPDATLPDPLGLVGATGHGGNVGTFRYSRNTATVSWDFGFVEYDGTDLRLAVNQTGAQSRFGVSPARTITIADVLEINLHYRYI